MTRSNSKIFSSIKICSCLISDKKNILINPYAKIYLTTREFFSSHHDIFFGLNTTNDLEAKKNHIKILTYW